MEAKAFDAVLSILLTRENLAVMIAAWMTLSVTKRIFPELFRRPVMVRVLPLLPMVLCMIFVWLPGIRPEKAQWGWLLILGMVLGWGIGTLHKVLKQTVMGQDVLIKKEPSDQ